MCAVLNEVIILSDMKKILNFLHLRARRLRYIVRRFRFKTVEFFLMCSSLKNWWVFALDFFGFLPYGKSYMLRCRSGVKMIFRGGTGESTIQAQIMAEGEYTHYFLKDIPNFSFVVDLGANTGVFAADLLSRNMRLRMLCIEPVTDNFALLKKNMETNGFLDRAHLLNCAAWSRSGTKIPIALDRTNTGWHSAVMERASARFEEVDTLSLKDILKNKKCDLLKVDIEGSEYEVLLNTDDATFKLIDRVVMEVHPVKGHEPQELKSVLELQGFTVTLEHKHIWAVRN